MNKDLFHVESQEYNFNYFFFFVKGTFKMSFGKLSYYGKTEQRKIKWLSQGSKLAQQNQDQNLGNLFS